MELISSGREDVTYDPVVPDVLDKKIRGFGPEHCDCAGGTILPYTVQVVIVQDSKLLASQHWSGSRDSELKGGRTL